jgi:hypothetical protein
MSEIVLPQADHGGVVNFLPFIAPMFLVVAGLLILVLRDRLGGRRDADGGDAASSGR